MTDDSTSAGPAADKKDEPQPTSVSAGKQPADEHEEHEDEHDHEDDHDEATGAHGDEPAGAETSSKKKKHKKKKKSATATAAATAATSGDTESHVKAALDSLPPAQVAELLRLNPAISQEILRTELASSASGSGSTVLPESAIAALKRLRLEDIMTGLAASGKNVKDMASYKFWQTQPVPRFGEGEGVGAPIEEGPIKVQTVDEVPKEPAKLIDGFEWVTVDLNDDEELQEVYDLLSGHFVEDGEAMFRFRYSKSILKWAMMSPGWTKDWHIGVRASQSRKLVAFISAIPLELRIRDKILHASEVNFLVIHKKLRSKRLAPVLIKEITRLCNLKGVFQALYTAGIVLPKPVSTARYYHRSINWQKLYEVGFSPLPSNSKPQFQIRKYALPDRTATKGLRELEARDIDAVQSLLTRYLARYDMVMEFTREEVEHWMLDKKLPGDEQVVYSYVVETDGKITDFFSFYCLDSSIINNPKHKVIRAAYLFYYATEVGLTTPMDKAAHKTRLNELMSDALILSKKYKFDVFNALSIMDNALFLEQQKYGPGDGQLHYYLFNYRANPITGGVTRRNRLDEENLSGIGFVMM